MDFEIQSITLSNALNVMENINELSDDEISAIEELRLSVRKEFLERRGDTTFEQETSEVLQYLHGLKKLFITNASKDKDDRIGEIQKDADFDVIFTSDLIRAINSAKLAFPNVKHIQDKRLRECNYGDLDGQDKSLVIYEEHIEKPFPNGESLKDVERRIDDFIKFLKDNYHGKKVGIVAHRAPQLAFEVLTKNISWEEANRNDWRKAKAWQPGWEYIIK